MWHPSGYWRTITKVDLVVVAVPSVDDKEAAEVLAFRSEGHDQRILMLPLQRNGAKGNSDFSIKSADLCRAR